MGGRALLLVHDEVPGRGADEVGSVPAALAGLDLAPLVATFLPGGPPPPAPETIDALVVFGSPAAADDDTLPWLGAERGYLGRALELGVPVLGICFGAQLLGRVLGGTVGRAARPERGFVAVRSTDHAVVPDGVWMQFHDDTVTLPPGARLVAANEVGVQAFRHRNSVGVQFHPEIDPTAFGAWVDSWRVAGELADVAAAVDLTALTAEVASRADASAAACRALVHRTFGPGAGRPGPPGRA